MEFNQTGLTPVGSLTRYWEPESESISHSVVSDSLRPHGLQPARLFCPWNSPGKNTGGGCHALLQGIMAAQGSNSGLPQCRQTLLSEPLGMRTPIPVHNAKWPFAKLYSWRTELKLSLIDLKVAGEPRGRICRRY